MGTCDPPATWAAVTDAPEHAAPTIALTPCPWNASRVKCSVAVRLSPASHLESRKANRSCVLGRR
eukprot:4718029-Prymnesium_polylepis.1